MNAPFIAPAGLVPIETVFRARCEARALLYINGQLSLHEAVDELQAYAEQSSFVDTIGQDDAQAVMSSAFFDPAGELLLEPSDDLDRGATDIVRGWELTDPRDAWRHTGEAPPLPEVRSGPLQPARPQAQTHRTPQSTIDAFWYVTRLDDPDYLKRWLAQHPRDVPRLQKLWEARHAVAQ
jgi:hypothetical protein